MKSFFADLAIGFAAVAATFVSIILNRLHRRENHRQLTPAHHRTPWGHSMLHSVITVIVCGVVLWAASMAVILAFAYAATKGRDRS